MSAARQKPALAEPIFACRNFIDHNAPTPAERETMEAFARHRDMGRVAMVQGLSRKTISNRLKLVREKLGARDNDDAIAKLRAQGLEGDRP